MFRFIDNFLNRITMYRLVLYILMGILALATVLGYFKLVPYEPVVIILSAIYILAISWIANKIFAWVFETTANAESVYITALILALIITPMASIGDAAFFSLATWASVWAMGSKFIFAIKKKHLFNPAALAVALTALTINQSASWWVGTLWLLPIVAASGLLIVRKIRRFDLFWAFILVAIAATVGPHLISGEGVGQAIRAVLVNSPLLFFATVMLTEPLTTPPSRWLRIGYGALVGLLFSPAIHLGNLYSTPELALLVGNICAYLVSPKYKLILRLKNRIKAAAGIYDFIFESDQLALFRPGQYMEWTLAVAEPDSRGNRRYFTLASAPTESDLRLGVKFYDKPSKFKKALLDMRQGDTITAAGLSGDFVLPKDKTKKLVFLAGGIGITPYRSMLQYLLDKRERRPITVFYSNRRAEDIAYHDIFDRAERELGIKTVYTLTDRENAPFGWSGEVGRLNSRMINKYLPDINESKFYLSGQHTMVDALETELKDLGIVRSQIKKDYFPGLV